MRELFCKSGTRIGLALFSPAALATQEERLMTLGRVPLYVFIAFVIVVFVSV